MNELLGGLQGLREGIPSARSRTPVLPRENGGEFTITPKLDGDDAEAIDIGRDGDKVTTEGSLIDGHTTDDTCNTDIVAICATAKDTSRDTENERGGGINANGSKGFVGEARGNTRVLGGGDDGSGEL